MPPTLAIASRPAPLDAAGKPDQLPHSPQVSRPRCALQLLHEPVNVASTCGLVLTPHSRVRQRLARLGLRRAANACDLSEPEATGMLG